MALVSEKNNKEDAKPSFQTINMSNVDLKTSAAVCQYMKLNELIEYEFYEIKKCEAALEELKRSKENQNTYIKFGNLFLKKKKDDLKEKLEKDISNLELEMMRNNEIRTVVCDKIRVSIEKAKNISKDSDDEKEKRENK